MIGLKRCMKRCKAGVYDQNNYFLSSPGLDHSSGRRFAVKDAYVADKRAEGGS